MIVSNIRKEKRGEEILLVADVESANYLSGENCEKQIWFSVPEKYGEYLTVDHYDGFLVALLYPAMAYGEDIEIDGAVSEKLLDSVNNYVIFILLAYSSWLKKIKVTAKETTDKIIESAMHIGTGFSGGVDSFCTVYDRFAQETNPKFKIDTLTNLNVGNYYGKSPMDTNIIFQEAYKRLSGFPDSVGLPYIPINSSLAFIYHQKWNFQKIYVLNTMAGVLIMQNYFIKYYFASTCAYSELPVFMKAYIDLDMAAFCEVYICQFLSTETLQFIPDGHQYTRTQKTERISHYSPTYNFLEVNVDKTNVLLKKNMRTLTALDTMDKLELYSKIFDLNNYKKYRFLIRCTLSLKYKKDPHAKDNIDFARLHGKKFPNRLVAFFYVNSISILKKIARLILPKKIVTKIKELMNG